MKRKYFGLSMVTVGITGLWLAGGVAWGQIGNECDPLWRNLGCCPHECLEEPSVPDYARECEESWRQEALPVAVAAVEDEMYAQFETATSPPAEEQVGEQPIAEGQASEDGDYWYDSDTNQYHRYRFAEHAADTPTESAWAEESYQADGTGHKAGYEPSGDLSMDQEKFEPLYDETLGRNETGGDQGQDADGGQIQVVEGEGCPLEPAYNELGDEPTPPAEVRDDFEKMFEVDKALTEGQPAVETVDEQVWADVPAAPSPDALLTVARALDRAGSVLHFLSRQLTELAEQELAKAPGGNMHR